jgi:hypothetical protein
VLAKNPDGGVGFVEPYLAVGTLHVAMSFWRMTTWEENVIAK